VDWLAGRIHDPVTRLRFLQAVGPPADVVEKSGLARFAWPFVLFTVAIGLALVQTGGERHPVVKPARPVAVIHPAPNESFSSIWLVENAGGSDLYSNGLRIDNRFVVANHPRAYLVVSRKPGGKTIRRTEPAGIVYHATESQLVPFEPDQNRALQRIGESLLEYVRRKRAYHFLIDRFGRVFRVVAESDSANHAGNSVWADEEFFYINLNQSFFGIAIEAQTHPGPDEGRISPAQSRAVAMLTEILRSRYQVRAGNCVTHAQVSVNPANMEVGYHTDWASGFPFTQLGLPDNYARPLPALWAFGFGFDQEFSERAGDRLTVGVQAGEAQLADAAAEAGVSPRDYRRGLQREYRMRLAEVRGANLAQTDDSE
jgi:hypothetical protein